MKFTRWLFTLLLVTALACGAFAYWLYAAMRTPVEHTSTDYITIEQGVGSNRILQILEEHDVIQAPLAAKLYLRFFDNGNKLQAGDYLFASPISPLEVIARLKDGKKRTKTLTIPEGWTRFEIAKRLQAQFPVEPPLTEEEVLAMMNDVSLIADFAPEAKNLEGFLYPTTYEVELDAHPKSVIEKMVKQFKSVWLPEWDEQARKINKSRFEIVTMASLIENESKIDAERALVASVIENRLEQGIPLGIDATNVYIAKLLNRWDGIIHKSDVEVDHPYNTRKIYGLPPGPISSASKSAFEAALNPAQTDYLYYVLNVEKGDGSHHFYATAAGFSKGKAAYQRWLAGQR
ncbi:endolytic transglycosylase MltG [Neolewinella aurantiaca]|uniref:Endolytic murein transglycosylase n=1 Tax=Neolewinella aurantiaca TaxID=2602767 RepID=A0A5C7FJW8_9BACT|nr:endolytic transglycosylase MltG [Neolewinella aurantiaca]TXF87637.1 endolytic transglycosylase MltG [Neolewinella aurantiaca]